MSMKLHDTRLLGYSMRQDLISWALRNCGKGAPMNILQSSLIPKLSLQRHSQSQALSFTINSLLPKYISKNHRVRLLLRRFNSTSTDTTPLAMGDPSQMMTWNDGSLDHELRTLLDKPKKSVLDIQKIQAIMTEASKSNEAFYNKYKYTTFRLLLRFKRHEYVESVLKSSKTSDIQDELLLAELYLLRDEIDKLKILTKSWDLKTCNIFTDAVSPFTSHGFGKPLKLFKLWIVLYSERPQDLKEFTLDCGSIFQSSLEETLKRVSNTSLIYSTIHSVSQDPKVTKDILLHVAMSYHKVSKPWDIHRLWLETSENERDSGLLALTLRALRRVAQSETALELFHESQHLLNDEVKDALFPCLISLELKSGLCYDTFCQIYDGSRTSFEEVLALLRRLLLAGRLSQFDTLITRLENDGYISGLDLINLKMKRSAEDPSGKGVLDYLRNINEINQKPNQETFEVIFEKFAMQGDTKATLSLLDLLIQRNEVLNIRHFTYMIEACIKAQDTKPATTILASLKKLKIVADRKFVGRLMTLHNCVNQFYRTEEVFFQYSSVIKPSVTMYHELIKAYFARDQHAFAHTAFASLKAQNFALTSYLGLVEIEYYSTQGLFVSAINTLTTMKENNIKLVSKHYVTLMRNYNKWGKYEDAVVAFNAAINNGHGTDPRIFGALITSLVKLNVIHRGNFEEPIAIVDNLIKESNKTDSPINRLLPFSVIKPLVKSLITAYRADDAARVMTNYLTVNPEFDVDYRLNYMKQQMRLAALNRDWSTFAMVYEKFQGRIKSLLDLDGVAPVKLKKIYNGLLKSIFLYHQADTRDQETKERDSRDKTSEARAKEQLLAKYREFGTLLHDLLFVHGFTFDSHQLNWVTKRLVRRRITFRVGLKIIERKLIGGYIGATQTKLSRAIAKRSGKRVSPFTFEGHYIKPHLKLAHKVDQVVRDRIYHSILSAHNANKREKRLQKLTKEYPKVMRTLGPYIMKRIRRRNRYLSIHGKG